MPDFAQLKSATEGSAPFVRFVTKGTSKTVVHAQNMHAVPQLNNRLSIGGKRYLVASDPFWVLAEAREPFVEIELLELNHG